MAKLVARRALLLCGTALEYHENGDLQRRSGTFIGRADEVFLLQPAHIPWQVAKWQKPAFSLHTGAAMWIRWQYGGENRSAWRPYSGDEQRRFGGIHQKLLDGLAKKAEAAQNSEALHVCVCRIKRLRRIRH